MPEQVWTNKGERMRIQAVLGLPLNCPIYLEGDHTASAFTGTWEPIDEGDPPELFIITSPVIATPPPQGFTGTWTLLVVNYNGTAPTELGDLYRYRLLQNGTGLLYGPLETIPDA